MINVLYRYQNHNDAVLLETHRIVKHTPKGYWIQDHAYAKKRFVLASGTKRYAYPDKELAKASFLARKERELGFLEARIKAVKDSIENMKEDKIGYSFSRSTEMLDFD